VVLLIDKLFYLVPIIGGIIAAYTDIKERKIRNKVTYPLILTGVIYQAMFMGVSGLKSSLTGILLCFVLMTIIPGFKFSGGDIKLSMGFGAYIGINALGYIAIAMFLFLIINIGNIIRLHGTRDLIGRVKIELLSAGRINTGTEKLAGAPILISSFIIILLIIH